MMFKMNGEYSFLAILMFIIMCFSSLFAIIFFLQSENYALFTLSLACSLFLIIFGILLLFNIHKNTSLKGLIKLKENCIKKWLLYTISYGYYSRIDIHNKFSGVFDYLINEDK